MSGESAAPGGWTIGVDGGATKTDLILVGPDGTVAARHAGPGSNPSVAGAEGAASSLKEGLGRLMAGAPHVPSVSGTVLCMAGNRGYWQAFAETLPGYGRVRTADDSLPVLELATRGEPGLVIHAGTGSFVAARGPDGTLHYAGGLGWRFGDEGSGHDLGRRAVAQVLLEQQGWAPRSALGERLPDLAALPQGTGFAAHFYSNPAAQAEIARLAPHVLDLAAGGDAAAGTLVNASIGALLRLAHVVTRQVFPGAARGILRAGVSGPILNHAAAAPLVAASAAFTPFPVTEPPIEGVRLLIARGAI